MQNPCAPYTPRNPRLSDYYRCVEDYLDELERVHEEQYQARFGYADSQVIEYAEAYYIPEYLS